MLNLKRLFIVTASMIALLQTPVQSASATEYNSGHRFNYGHHGYNRHQYARHGRHHSHHNTFAFSPSHNYGNYGSSLSSSSHHYNQGTSCRSTYKYQYDEHGNKIRINGTLCYDSYGNAYIVPGSRYVANNYH